jgi:hypothetical protein
MTAFAINMLTMNKLVTTMKTILMPSLECFGGNDE